VADVKLAFGRELQNVATVSLHHPPDFRNDDVQKSFEINVRRQITRETSIIASRASCILIFLSSGKVCELSISIFINQ
jgi:hypothetical protein